MCVSVKLCRVYSAFCRQATTNNHQPFEFPEHEFRKEKEVGWLWLELNEHIDALLLQLRVPLLLCEMRIANTEMGSVVLCANLHSILLAVNYFSILAFSY